MVNGIPTNNMGTGSAQPVLNKEKASLAQAKEAVTGVEDKVQNLGGKGKNSHISAAKTLIQQAMDSLNASRPDLTSAQQNGTEAEEKVLTMTPHIKSINLDYVLPSGGKDVSADGEAVRAIAGDTAAEATAAEKDIKAAAEDVAGVEKNIDDALAHLEEVKGDRSVYGAKYELNTSKDWLEWTTTDIGRAGKYLELGKGSINEMNPFLDIIEQDTEESDVGRFADDLQELQKETRGRMMDASITAKFANENIDNINGYLTKALNHLK